MGGNTGWEVKIGKHKEGDGEGEGGKEGGEEGMRGGGGEKKERWLHSPLIILSLPATNKERTHCSVGVSKSNPMRGTA